MRPGGLCVSLTPETVDEVFEADLSRVDCVEVRLDYLRDLKQSTDTRWDRLRVPVIVTCRGKDRGGLFEDLPEEELAILQNAARNGARFVDIDYRLASPVAGAQVIASCHNFKETPDDLASILDRVCAANGNIAKLATQVNSWSDNRRLLGVMSQRWPKPAIVVGMGEIGQITRVLGPSRGSFLTFAAAGRQSAPGQLNVDEMLDVYRLRRIDRSTKLLGIVGMPVGHSWSPWIHNRAFDATRYNFVYLKFPAPSVKDFIDSARDIGILGFSVTIPHKIDIISCIAGLSPAAREIGAVNTVTDMEGWWTGDNTDVHGVRVALSSSGYDPTGKRVVILGRGGAAKAAAAALKNAREVVMLSRQEMRNLSRYPCDLLINATPVGMHPDTDASPVDGPIAAEAVFDMVYNPRVTKLLQTAASQGKTVIDGATMLLAQAARQFEIWTGKPAPPEIFETRLEQP